MVKIIDVVPGSIAEELGILPGDAVVSINGKEIRDALDFRFYATDEQLELLIQRGDEQIVFEIEKDYDENIGVELEDLEMRSCGNKCIFCFVFQNPKGLRKSLYFKDEDYRFSFLYGHYVTLTNARRADLERIVEQRLSPLYVSVHTTEPELRRLMLGIKFDDHLLKKIEYLTSRGIELNCQIVLCPDLNDGEHLMRTLDDLSKFYPGVRSVAIVPVGLTRHRKNLYPIKPVTNEYSLQLMETMETVRKEFREKLGSSFVYLSDEFYIRTGQPIPEDDYYEGFYQLENGVGLTRDFINRFQSEYPELPRPERPLKISLVTGVLGSKVFEQYFWPQLTTIPNVQFYLHTVINHFFGESITVSGLLVGQDIYRTLQEAETGEYIVLPPRCLNHDGLFLDDWTVPMLEQRLGKRVIISSESFREIFETILEDEKTYSDNYR